MTAIVGYIRVSTKMQGDSGLGLEAQLAAIERYAAQINLPIIRTFKEVESGRKSDRPQLRAALAHARRNKAKLVVAKLDRLARNVAFTSALMESGVDFIACDNPSANRLTIHILAAVAEAEAESISQRTKAALGAYKARGGVLGASRPECRNLTHEARTRGATASGIAAQTRARTAYSDLVPVMVRLRREGFTQSAIADELNKLGHSTRTGNAWTQVQVQRALRRENL